MQIIKQSGRNHLWCPSHAMARKIMFVAGICLCAVPAWAGPYSSGQFGLYGLYVFLYLALPAILVLTIAKTMLWSKLTAPTSGQKLLILKAVASLALAALEFLFATVIITVVALASGQAPLIAEIDKYTIWGALGGWGLFFLILGGLDVQNNRWLLRNAQSGQPDRVFPEKAIYAGAIGLWLALGMLAIVAYLLSLRF